MNTTFLISGLKADGKTVNTKFIQEAIDKCNADGGGTVIVPTGTYITGMIYLKDNVTFNLQKGSTLISSTDIKDFPTNSEYDKCIISIDGKENVSLIGEGTIDGQGDKFTVMK